MFNYTHCNIIAFIIHLIIKADNKGADIVHVRNNP